MASDAPRTQSIQVDTTRMSSKTADRRYSTSTRIVAKWKPSATTSR